MKLRDIQEASYHVHPVVMWIKGKIRSRITKKVCLSHDDLYPSKDGYQLMLKEITKEFGNPREAPGAEGNIGPNVNYHWKTRDYEIHLFLWDWDSKTKKNIDEPKAGVCVQPIEDLNEASYAGEHPIIGIIKRTFQMRHRADQFYDIEQKDIKKVVKSLKRFLGEPRFHGTYTWYWSTRLDDKNAYAVDIGYDDEINPPYGITITHYNPTATRHYSSVGLP